MNYDIVESKLRDELHDLKRRHNRTIERLKDYENEDKLSKHGMWSKGYFTAKSSMIEDEIYFLESILEKIDTINNNKFNNLVNGIYNQKQMSSIQCDDDLRPLSLSEEINVKLNKKCKLISEE